MLARRVLGQHLGDRRAQTADDAVLLAGDHDTGLASAPQDGVLIERLDGVRRR